jgi:hypothetical protein
MRIEDFTAVEILVDLRAQLIHWRDYGKIGIEINSGRMNPDFVKAVEPAIRLELRHRINDIEDRLKAFGVVFGA